MTYTFSEDIFSDFHKDAYGRRPTADHPFYSSSDDEKQRIWDQTSDAMDASGASPGASPAGLRSLARSLAGSLAGGAQEPRRRGSWSLAGEALSAHLCTLSLRLPTDAYLCICDGGCRVQKLVSSVKVQCRLH